MTREECTQDASKYISKDVYPNPNQFTRWYFKNNLEHAWCGAFIDYVVKHDLNCNWLDTCSNFAYVPTIVKWAKEKGYWNNDYTKAKKGDLVIYNFNLNKENNYSHVGIVDNIIKDGIISIEGNTSSEKYSKNCVLKKQRNKKYIKGVVLLPYKDGENMFNIGDEVIALEDVKLYTTIEQKESKYTIKKGEKAYVRLTHSPDFIALADIVTGDYFPSAWTKEQSKFKLNEIDYKYLYEEQLKINEELQNKIDKAIEDLK